MSSISSYTLARNYKEYKIEAIKVFVLFLLFPPVISLLFATLRLFEKKKYLNLKIFSFSFFYALLLTYITPHYDTIQRFWDFNELSGNFAISFRPLTILGSFLTNNLPLQSYHIFFLLYFTIIIFNVKSFLQNNQLSSFSILIAITIIYCRNICDLTYYTLAVSICLYFITKNKITVWKLAILILLIFLIHPGFLLYLLPAIFLYYLLKLKYYKLTFVYLIIFFIVTYRLFSVTEPIPNINNEFFNNFINLFNSYVTSEGQWGRRINMSNLSEGIRLNIFFFLLKVLIFFVLACLIKYRKEIENIFLLSIYIASVIIYFNAYGLYTINERTVIANIIIGAYLIVPIIDRNKNKILKKIYSILVVVIFLFSLNIYNPPRSIIFYDKYSSYNISFRIFYIPSIALIFYNYMGFSDDYLLKNAKYNPVFNPQDNYN